MHALRVLSPAAAPAAHPAVAAGTRRQIPWRSLERVLAVRLDNLGDVVQTTPALRALATHAPQARLDLLVSRAGAALAPLLPWVGEVLTASPSWQDAAGRSPDPAAELALVERLRGYDAVVVFTSFSQSPWPMAYAATLAGVPVRVGGSREFGGSLLSHWVTPAPDDLTAHQVDRMLHLLDAVGVPSAGTRLELRLPTGQRAGAADVAGAYVLLAPGASAPARRWAAAGFAAAARRLLASGLAVLVTGTAREHDLVEAVVRGAPGSLASTDLDVVELAGAVAGATAVLGNNSGTMHLADALGTPVVAAFAGTETEGQYAPRGVPARLLRVPTPCAPCRAFVCPLHGEGAQACLELDPARVADAVLEVAWTS